MLKVRELKLLKKYIDSKSPKAALYHIFLDGKNGMVVATDTRFMLIIRVKNLRATGILHIDTVNALLAIAGRSKNRDNDMITFSSGSLFIKAKYNKVDGDQSIEISQGRLKESYPDIKRVLQTAESNLYTDVLRLSFDLAKRDILIDTAPLKPLFNYLGFNIELKGYASLDNKHEIIRLDAQNISVYFMPYCS